MSFIDRAGWTVTADATGAGSPANVIDGDITTYWQPTNFGQPHWLAFDMGAAHDISAIAILNLAGGTSSNVSVVNLYVSTDGIAWGAIVETITFSNTTNYLDYWLLAATHNTRYFKLEMRSFNGVSMFIAEVNAGTLGTYLLNRPTSTSFTVGTCGDITLNPGLAIDNEEGSPPADPTTYATVQQLACGAFANQSVLTCFDVPAQAISTDQFVQLTIWVAVENSNSQVNVTVKNNGISYPDSIAGGKFTPPSYGVGSPYKYVWILPSVTDISNITVDFGHYNSVGGLRFPDLLYVYDCYIEVGYAIAPTTGNIVIVKATAPSGSAQNFDFTSDYGDPFSLLDGQSNDSGPLVPATYAVTETPISGWSISTSSDPASILVVAGETTIVTFTNTLEDGNIVIEKVTVPAGSRQSFDFTSDYGSPFSLTDGESNDSGPLAPETYSVVETHVAGWATSYSQDPSAIVVNAGETTTVTVTNTESCVNSGIVELDPTLSVDICACIDARYVTYGFSDFQDRAQLQLGNARIFNPYALVDISGDGQFTFTVLPENIDTPYPFTQVPFTLDNPSNGDVNVPLNVSANRAFVDIETAGNTCGWWSLREIDLGCTPDPRMLITGR